MPRTFSKGMRATAYTVLALCSGCSESVFEPASRPLQVDAPNAKTSEPTLPSLVVSEEGVPKVVFLGDEIAAGQHLATEQAFPSILQRRLRSRGTQLTVINSSVSGDTTRDGLQRVSSVLAQKPALVVIELGENDVRQGVPVATIEANLRALVSQLRAAKVKVLLLGAHGPNERSRADYARDLEAMYTRLAQELELTLVPSFMRGVAGHRELTLSDGIEPTPEGHDRIATNLTEPLRSLLAE